MPSKPLVSICCATYNHEPFIRDAIEGFLAQDVEFPFEIIINDDASTDGTAAIIREYEAKYPDLVRATYQDENQYSRGGVSLVLHFLFPRAKGKYIALCEGDDYWTDPHKLKKQVDILERSPDHVLACGGWVEVGDDRPSRPVIHGEPGDGRGFSFGLRDMVSEYLTQTMTVIFRADALRPDELAGYQLTRDVHLFYHIMKKGRGFYLRDTLGAYRRHAGGIYTSLDTAERTHLRYRIYRELHDNSSDYYTKRKFFIAASDLIVQQLFWGSGERREEYRSLVGDLVKSYESPKDVVRLARRLVFQAIRRLMPKSLYRRLKQG